MNDKKLNKTITDLGIQFVLVFDSEEKQSDGKIIRWYFACRTSTTDVLGGYTSFDDPICKVGIYSTSVAFEYVVKSCKPDEIVLCSSSYNEASIKRLEEAIITNKTGNDNIIYCIEPSSGFYNIYDKMHIEDQLNLANDILNMEEIVNTNLYVFYLNNKYKKLFKPYNLLMQDESYLDTNLAADLCGECLYNIKPVFTDIKFTDADENKVLDYQVSLRNDKLIGCKSHNTISRSIYNIIDLDKDAESLREMLELLLKDIRTIRISTIAYMYEPVTLFGDLNYKIDDDTIEFYDLNYKTPSTIFHFSLSISFTIHECIRGIIRGCVYDDVLSIMHDKVIVIEQKRR